MASTINADNGVVSGSSGVKTTADTSGVLALQSNGSTGVTLNTDLSVTFAGAQTLSAGTANGVTYLNGSKVLTSGSALTFNASTLAIATAANDQLTWTGGRTGYLYADSAGIGIGDTALLAGNATYYNKTSNYIANYINGSEQMRLTSTGLGIGTSSPSAKLDVNGNLNVSSSGNIFTASTSGIFFNGNGSFATGLYNNGSANLLLAVNGSTRYQFGSAGQLGIGGATYGSSGQVLTSGGSGAAPTWSTPSSGAMVYITDVTASGAGAIDLSSGFSSTYDQYVLVGQNFSMSTTASMYVRFYIGGSLVTSANYGTNVGRLSGGNWSEALGGSSGQSQGFVLGTGTTYGATGNFNFVGYVNQPSNTGIYKQFYWSGSFTNSSGLAFPYWGSTGLGNTGAFTGIYFYPSTGTITGTLRLYGIVNN